MDERSKAFSELADYILFGGDVYKATKYLTEQLTIKATRKRFKNKIYKTGKITEIMFTIGRPNYQEREFIKLCKKSGEPFPIKKVQLKKQR
jgi:hypothetical protein